MKRHVTLLAPSVSASTTNSLPSFPTEPLAASWSSACQIVRASERFMVALSLKFILPSLCLLGNCSPLTVVGSNGAARI